MIHSQHNKFFFSNIKNNIYSTIPFYDTLIGLEIVVITQNNTFDLNRKVSAPIKSKFDDKSLSILGNLTKYTNEIIYNNILIEYEKCSVLASYASIKVFEMGPLLKMENMKEFQIPVNGTIDNIEIESIYFTEKSMAYLYANYTESSPC